MSRLILLHFFMLVAVTVVVRAQGRESASPQSARPDELSRLRAIGHAMYWDKSKGPYPPGVAHPSGQ